MPLIRISTNKQFPQMNQTPGASGVLGQGGSFRWGEFEYIINERMHKTADYWIVYNDLAEDGEDCSVPWANTFFIPEEPPAYRFYNRKFQRQFAHLYSSHKNQHHHDHHYGQQYLQWYVGSESVQDPLREAVDYTSLSALNLQLQAKQPVVSILASNKRIIAGHRNRQVLIEKLKNHFKDRVAVLGGDKYISKWHSLAPYQYHLAIENSIAPHYWSEKLADPLLAWTFPIYAGAPNVKDYFPEGSMANFELNDWESAKRTIEQTLETPWTEARTTAMAEARRRILEEYNLFSLIPNHYAAQANLPKKEMWMLAHRIFDNPMVIARRQLFKLMRRMNTEWRP